MASLLATKRGGVEASTFQVSVCYERRRYKLPGWSMDAVGKALSEELGRNVTRLLQCKASGAIPPELRRYVETLPARIRRSMAKQGIIEPSAEGKSITAHVEDYLAALTARAVTPYHVSSTGGMIATSTEAAKFKMLGDVTPAKLRAYLTDRRTDKPKLDAENKPLRDAAGNPVMVRGISARRHNAILAAWGGFFRWCVKERRAFENPIIQIPKLNERTDQRHQRRALTEAEVRALLTAADAGAELYGITGAERKLVYRVAVETGLRMNELATLTRDCIDLNGCTLTVRAVNSKHRREDVLPMRAELVEALRTHVEKKTPAARVFDMPNRYRVLDAFHVDRQAAAIARCDDSGRVVDFHALRHTFISSLASAGVHPKTAQTLARHSTITLTMDRYTHILRGAEAAALQALPNYSTPNAAEAKKTGTDDVPLGVVDARQGIVGKLGGKSGGARGVNQCRNETTVDKLAIVHRIGENAGKQGFSGELLGVGIEPLRIRREIRGVKTKAAQKAAH